MSIDHIQDAERAARIAHRPRRRPARPDLVDATGTPEVVLPGATPAGRRQLPATWPQVQLAGLTSDLFEVDDAIDLIVEHARSDSGEVLGVVSVNLDHVHHFGSGRTSARLNRRKVIDLSIAGQVRWLSLLDGAPLVRRAGELTGRPWPRLAGSDLVEPILSRAARLGITVGFLGGSRETQDELKPVLARRWPELQVRGFWSPSRAQLDDPRQAADLATEIRREGVDILVVCLGKPRQEEWIAAHALDSGARVCLAFGAVVDFLAGRMNRAPRWVADHGMEWAWRLGNEPRRLARRYLLQGPPAYRALQNDSFVRMPTTYFRDSAQALGRPGRRLPPQARFAARAGYSDVAVVVVTHDDAEDIDHLITSLRGQLDDQSVRVVVVDNGSVDGTAERAGRHPDVTVVRTGADLGWAGGLNAGRPALGDAGAVLILDPNLELAPGSLRILRERLLHDDVGVAVPRLLDAYGEVYASLRREPSLTRALGDALLGERLSSRPARFSEIELDRRHYRHPHAVDWATGAALLIKTEALLAAGDWDENFFRYSDDTDFLHRVRSSGWAVWFEPAATLRRRRNALVCSDSSEALMAVNRVRYAEKWQSAAGATLFRSAVILGSLLRVRQTRHRLALRYLTSRERWAELPGPGGS
jgi:exopolysaccharide biosynthesis WecB/TagA/CpsF family protein